MATTLAKLFPTGVLQSRGEIDEITLQDTPPVTGLHYLITFYNNNFRLNFIEQSSWVNFTAQMNIGDAVYATHGSSGRLYYGVITAFDNSAGGPGPNPNVTNPLGHPAFFGTYDGQSTYFEVGGLTNFAGVRVSPTGIYAKEFDEVALTPSIGLGLTGSVLINERGYGIASDSSGNRYGVGKNGETPSKFGLIKNDTTGNVLWQRELAGSDVRTQGYKVVTDSLGNVYAVGLDELNSSPFTKWLVVVKFNSSGTIQWQRKIETNNNTIASSIALDTSNNVYIVSSDYTSNSNLIAVKYNSSGTVQWQRKFYSTAGGSVEGTGLAVDSAGNVYACGRAFGKAIIVKFNTSGVYQWVYSLGGEYPQSTYSYGMTVDSSDNLYMVGNVYNSTSAKQEMLLFKLNSSGTQQWQRTLGSNSTNTYGYATTVDSSGNVYVTGMTNTVWDIYIAKYNTSGTLQWQRTLGSTAYEIGQSISVTPAGDIHLTGLTSASGTEDIFFATLPSDGSRTGTHIIGGYSFNYSVSSMTAATSTLSYSSGTPGYSTSNNDPSLTESAGVLTVASSALTVTTNSGGGTIPAERKTSTGIYQVSGYFDEVSLSPDNEPGF